MSQVVAEKSDELSADIKTAVKDRNGVDIVWRDVRYTASTKNYSRDILKGLTGICK